MVVSSRSRCNWIFLRFLTSVCYSFISRALKRKTASKVILPPCCLNDGSKCFGHLFGGMMTDGLFAWTSLTMLQAIQVTLFSACVLACVAFFFPY